MKTKFKVIIILLAALIIGLTAFIAFYYMTQFSLSLNGPEEMKIGLHALYTEPGAKATVRGKDVSAKIKISGEVDTSVPGEYKVNYRIATLMMTRTVYVGDTMNPEIILKPMDGNNEIILGDTYNEPGYTATDENGKDITDKVIVTGSSLKKAGINYVAYTVSDANGNTTRITREVKVLANPEYTAAGLPICMYHYVYDENNPPDDLYNRFGNYISAQALEEELEWLNEQGYYYPSWQEVRDYAEGKLILPEKSIVLCFDDGSKSFLEYGIPVLEKCKVPATCFVITSNNGESKVKEYQSEYVHYESHSHNMHRGGGEIGHGGIFTAVSEEEGLADLQKSIEICGSNDAFAYPFGDYNDTSKAMVEQMGFLCAVTTDEGKVYPGDDPLLLPRVRMSLGQTLEEFISMIS